MNALRVMVVRRIECRLTIHSGRSLEGGRQHSRTACENVAASFVCSRPMRHQAVALAVAARN
jgi:hypothetical protein